MKAAHAVTRREPELIDVLDRVLDKGIVITCDIDISVVGLRAIEITGDVIIASFDTYLRFRGPPAPETQNLDALTKATDEYLRQVDHARRPPH